MLARKFWAAVSLMIAVQLIIFSGCMPLYYRVSVTGYKENNLEVVEGNKVYVYMNGQASNLLLEKEIVAKIKTMLKIKSYVPVDKPEDADFTLFSAYGIGTGQSVTYSSSGYNLNVFTGQFETVSQVDSSTEYPRYLKLGLYEAKTSLLSQNPEPVWVGDVQSTGSSTDLRSVIDYLIVTGFEYFGQDTGKQQVKVLLPIDERVKRLREEMSYKESNNPHQTPSVDVSGNWSGSWISGNGINGGKFSMSLTQNGPNLNGNIIMDGSPCFSAGNIAGIVSRNNITSVISYGGLHIDFNGTMVSNNINGSYVVINGGICTGDSGTWMVSK